MFEKEMQTGNFSYDDSEADKWLHTEISGAFSKPVEDYPIAFITLDKLEHVRYIAKKYAAMKLLEDRLERQRAKNG